ncbi:unnamed protein product [Ixodes pacificus]
MLLSVERDVLMMQEEAVKPPPPSTATTGPRATDFSIAAIMARESPGQLPSASTAAAASTAASASGESPLARRRRAGAHARSPLPRGRRRMGARLGTTGTRSSRCGLLPARPPPRRPLNPE